MVCEAATRYRAMVARCNFLGCDRPDLQYAKKEASRWMATPCHEDFEKRVRIGKYLNGGYRRIVQGSLIWERRRRDHGLFRLGLGRVSEDTEVHDRRRFVYRRLYDQARVINPKGHRTVLCELYSATRAPSEAKDP